MANNKKKTKPSNNNRKRKNGRKNNGKKNNSVTALIAKNGRPTKYDPRFINVAEMVARRGIRTSKEVAEIVGVSRATLYNWCKAHPEFLDALKRGKEIDNAEIEAALKKRAMGYDIEEKDVMIRDGGRDGTVRQVTKRTRHVPSDPTALIFWLVNRKSEDWKRHQHDVPGDDGKIPDLATYLIRMGNQNDPRVEIIEPEGGKVLPVDKEVQQGEAGGEDDAGN